MIRDEFKICETHGASTTIAEAFSQLLGVLEKECGTSSRAMSIVRTKLEEACFFAQKAAALASATLINSDLRHFSVFGHVTRCGAEIIPGIDWVSDRAGVTCSECRRPL